MDEILSLLRRLEPSEAERTIVDLESRCARFEGDLEMTAAEIEELKRERGVLMSRVEELEEENRCRREVAHTVRGLLAELEPGQSSYTSLSFSFFLFIFLTVKELFKWNVRDMRLLLIYIHIHILF
ncbi:hypothetical protein AXF42_Ash000243 [Apostasia shenzhenica]|uniref:Uncharacterized protein n=1 Tax=Apostasia shenzhenica TaxID=1088818 RepID=A0A2I0AFT5_9ASPA|nr:hypothetical protein AXF42_Ash000243 [Apostasia shenzhenica]